MRYFIFLLFLLVPLHTIAAPSIYNAIDGLESSVDWYAGLDDGYTVSQKSVYINGTRNSIINLRTRADELTAQAAACQTPTPTPTPTPAPSSNGWSVAASIDSWPVGVKPQGSDGFSEAFGLTISDDAQVMAGSRAAKIGITAGSTGFGQWGGSFNFPTALKEGDQLWYRVGNFFPTTFNYAASPRLKFLRVHTRPAAGGNEGYIDLYIKPSGYLCFDSEITNYTTAETLNIGTPVGKGVWETYEVYVKFHATPGQGIVRIWQNGVMVYENTAIKTLKSSTSLSDFAYLYSYWNGGAPATQSSYVDDIRLTTETPAGRDAAGNPMIGP